MSTQLSVRPAPRRAILRLVPFALAAVVVGGVIAPPARAQEIDARAKKEPAPIEVTFDVAEDLSGTFVPTFVRPDHTQPERGSFYVTGGRVFPRATARRSTRTAAATSASGSGAARTSPPRRSCPMRRSGR